MPDLTPRPDDLTILDCGACGAQDVTFGHACEGVQPTMITEPGHKVYTVMFRDGEGMIAMALDEVHWRHVLMVAYGLANARTISATGSLRDTLKVN